MHVSKTAGTLTDRQLARLALSHIEQQQEHIERLVRSNRILLDCQRIISKSLLTFQIAASASLTVCMMTIFYAVIK